MVEFQIRRRGLTQPTLMPRRLKIKRGRIFIALTVGLMVMFGGYRYISADMSVEAVSAYSQPTLPHKQPLSWPAYGQSAVATPDYGVLETHGSTAPQPTASTAKLITVLAVMEKSPFNLGEQGNVLTITQADVDRFESYVAMNGSNVPVQVGEKLTQYQAMQGILLASSNNLADTLAIRTFGSLDAYRDYATKMLERYGLKNTTIGSDASGIDPETTSTAHDLALIAIKALEQPVIASIASQSATALPVAGTIRNTNLLLGEEGVVGLKTGFTNEAGGVFVLAANQVIDGHTQQIVTVIMGADTSRTAQLDSYRLYLTARNNFTYQTFITKGQVVGLYAPAWSNETHEAIAQDSIGAFVWAGSSVKTSAQFDILQPTTKRDAIGTVVVKIGDKNEQTTAKLNKPIDPPSVWWRIISR